MAWPPFFYLIQIITLVLLSLAATTSFGGLPVLASLLARDNLLPHVFGLRADRRVFRYGVGVLAVAAALLPLFAIGVFAGFTLSQWAWSGIGLPNGRQAGS